MSLFLGQFNRPKLPMPNRPQVYKDPQTRQWSVLCLHGMQYQWAAMNTWAKAMAFALQHVEDAHPCVSTR